MLEIPTNEVINSASTRELTREGCNRKVFHAYELREYGLDRDFHTDPDLPPEPGKEVSNAATTGNVLHELSEARFLGIENIEEYARTCRPEYPDVCPKNSQHSWAYAKLTFGAYEKKYPLEKELPIWETPEGFLSLEHKWTESSTKEGSLFRDKGFFDRVLVCADNNAFMNCFGVDPRTPLSSGGIGRDIMGGGELILADTKSTGRKLNDRVWRAQLYNKVQFPLYCHQLHQMADNFYGLVLVDAIQHTKTKRSFDRFFFSYTKDEIEKAIASSDQRIMRALETPDDFDSSCCFSYGRKCSFYRLCHDPEYLELPIEERFQTFLLENPTSVNPLEYQKEIHTPTSEKE